MKSRLVSSFESVVSAGECLMHYAGLLQRQSRRVAAIIYFDTTPQAMPRSTVRLFSIVAAIRTALFLA